MFGRGGGTWCDFYTSRRSFVHDLEVDLKVLVGLPFEGKEAEWSGAGNAEVFVWSITVCEQEGGGEEKGEGGR